MQPFIQSDAIEVRRLPDRGRGGRGVFARRALIQGEIIERVPAIVIPRKQVFGESPVALRACRISWYVFAWAAKENEDNVAIPLGYGSLYNHSYRPNAGLRIELPDIMEFAAIRDIAQEEEITINYNGNPHDKTPVTFPFEN
jgi:SET domain-containing protein